MYTNTCFVSVQLMILTILDTLLAVFPPFSDWNEENYQTEDSIVVENTESPTDISYPGEDQTGDGTQNTER